MSGGIPINRVSVLGMNVFSDDLAKIPLTRPCATVACINPIAYGIATSDPEFFAALSKADYLVLDGVYFGLAGLLLEHKWIKANQGPDVFSFFIRKLDAMNGKAFFLGSSAETLQKIKNRVAMEYPNVAVDVFSPPFKSAFDDQDNRAMLERIDGFGPDILFVGMTAPKQENWVHKHRDQINATLAISIGAVFDWYAGTQKAIAPIWWKLKLAWLIRTIRRPEILKRYPWILVFCWYLLLAFLGIKKYDGKY